MSDYPKVMRGKLSGVIVKMIAYGVGTVVGSGHSRSHDIGFHCDKWSMSCFKPYKPEIAKTKEEL